MTCCTHSLDVLLSLLCSGTSCIVVILAVSQLSLSCNWCEVLDPEHPLTSFPSLSLDSPASATANSPDLQTLLSVLHLALFLVSYSLLYCQSHQTSTPFVSTHIKSLHLTWDENHHTSSVVSLSFCPSFAGPLDSILLCLRHTSQGILTMYL